MVFVDFVTFLGRRKKIERKAMKANELDQALEGSKQWHSCHFLGSHGKGEASFIWPLLFHYGKEQEVLICLIYHKILKSTYSGKKSILLDGRS